MAKRKSEAKSETTTEKIFRVFYGADTFIEKSAIPSSFGFISKKKTGEPGYPDFFKEFSDYVIVVEAKADDFNAAITEVKWYMEKNLIIDKDILGIAISGQNKDALQVSYFSRFLKNESFEEIQELTSASQLLSLTNIEKIYHKKKYGDSVSDTALTSFLSELNKKFHKKNIVRDTNRSLFFSGLMIALNDENFRKTYKNLQKPSSGIEAKNINESILKAISDQLENKVNNFSKQNQWRPCFAFISTIDIPLKDYKKIISDIEEKIFIPFKHEEKYDILGRAYKIFLSRAGKIENKNIILTPDHIKNLMVLAANLSVDDVVLDTCTGSGGFLMSAMEKLIELSKGDDKVVKRIKEKQLIGFELDEVLYALACSNMFLHGDGRSNLIHRSSLLDLDNLVEDNSGELREYIHSLKPTKCIINPPYENNQAFDFVWSAIDYLEQNGQLIIIMPSITLEDNLDKKRGKAVCTEKLLERASLDFEIKMPLNLFREQRRIVQTSIFGFTKKPHNKNKDVLFYNLKDDGLESVQHKGRVDTKNQWGKIENEILDFITNGKIIPEVSYKRKIYKNGVLDLQSFVQAEEGYFPIKNLFNVEVDPQKIQSTKNTDGKYPFITAATTWKTHNTYSYDKEALVYAIGAEGSLGNCHYVNGKFSAASLCLVLTEKDHNKFPLNLKFYQSYFESIKRKIREGAWGLKRGKSKQTISKTRFENFKIPFVNINDQNKTVEELEVKKAALNKLEREKELLNSQMDSIILNVIETKK